MTTPQAPLRPKEIHTRFLYPFFFERSQTRQAQETLSAATITVRGGQEVSIWERAAPPGLYKEELLDHVVNYLFDEAGRGCRYLRLSNTASSRWFKKAKVVISAARAKKMTEGDGKQSEPLE